MATRLSLLLAVLMLVSPLAQAKKDSGNAGYPQAEERNSGSGAKSGKAAKKGGGDETRPSAAISIGITVGAARDIAREAGLSPGSYQALPPGMYKRLAKGKPLPPGIAKKQVPPAMLSRLPAHPGHEWLVIGVDLVLVNIKTRLLIDILPGVF